MLFQLIISISLRARKTSVAGWVGHSSESMEICNHALQFTKLAKIELLEVLNYYIYNHHYWDCHAWFLHFHNNCRTINCCGIVWVNGTGYFEFQDSFTGSFTKGS